MRIPPVSKTNEFLLFVQDLTDTVMVSVSARAAEARTLKTLRYTGDLNGVSSIYNRLDTHIDRLTSYLYAPTDLRFMLEFDGEYGPEIHNMGKTASRKLTKTFEKSDTDLQVGTAFDQALMYGSWHLKVSYGNKGIICHSVPPWSMGLYREDKQSLDEQEAFGDVTYITPEDLWRRIAHLPNAEKLWKDARAYATPKSSEEPDDTSYIHQILLTGTDPVVDSVGPPTGGPGGLSNMQMNPSPATVAPSVASSLIAFYELWVVDDETGDYTTIQYVKPDIIITPTPAKKSNLFLPHEHPYSKFQVNKIEGYYWGRSEMAGLVRLQSLLSMRCEDIKSIMSKQYDRMRVLLGFQGDGENMMNVLNNNGWMLTDNPSAKVQDVTPEMPKEAFQELEKIIQMMDDIGGFTPILGGQGESGVRSGNHANTLLKTSSPRLRDRSILAERQVADLADKILQMMQAKDATKYLTTDKQEFLLSQLPDDYRVVVDSHSTSPIYQDDHLQLVMMLSRLKFIDGESALEMLDVPMKDTLIERYKKMKAAEAQMLKEHPELLAKGHGKH